MAAAEPIQQDGFEGVSRAKRWLESSTWIELPFDAYNNAPICTVKRLDQGGQKLFDLFGQILRTPATPLYVEVKNYHSVGGKQAAEYWEFLANAYSATAKFMEDMGDARSEFMWVTWHPFDQTNWVELTKPSRISEALAKHPEVLGKKPIDQDLLPIVSQRLWLLVLHARQYELTLTPQELSIVESKLNRKGRL